MIKKRFFSKKLFSQNFLIKASLIESFFFFKKEKKIIIEVGPGIGNITRYLSIIEVEFLFLIEIDTTVKIFLSNIYYLKKKKIKIFWDDILYIDENNFHKFPYSVVANLPYNICCNLLIKCMYRIKKKKVLFFLLQKEFAEKILFFIKKKDFKLNIVLGTFFNKNSLSVISIKNFYPIPRINSLVIKFTNKVKLDKYNCINKLLKILFLLYEKKHKLLFNSCIIDTIKFIILNILVN